MHSSLPHTLASSHNPQATGAFPVKLIRAKQALDLYGTQKSKFHADVKEGLMTDPLKLSGRLALWPEYEVSAVNAARIAGQSPDQIRSLVAALMATRPDFGRFAKPWIGND